MVTIDVDYREWRFGSIEHGVVQLNAAGRMVKVEWQALPARFPGVELDDYVVMPDHVHGILFIGTDPEVQPPTLSRVMQAFKSITAVRYGRGVRDGRYPPLRRALWQRSFHDRVLRDGRDLDVARGYVTGNPGSWQDDVNWKRWEGRHLPDREEW
jgi:REP element-mobilizing transposase RayT